VDQNERNRLLAEEFRNNGGFVNEEKFKGAHLLLLTTAGRKSGKKYTTPVQYLPDGERYVGSSPTPNAMNCGGASSKPSRASATTSAGRHG